MTTVPLASDDGATKARDRPLRLASPPPAQVTSAYGGAEEGTAAQRPHRCWCVHDVLGPLAQRPDAAQATGVVVDEGEGHDDEAKSCRERRAGAE
ncbi:hypothetical protein RJ55_01490 [Drechmeria coniospora]|nr:hypothetical protein RJ55_01490 [Drechmeria coniospora]